MLEFVQHLEEVSYAAGHAITGPNQNYVEATAASVRQQGVQAWPAWADIRDIVRIALNDLVTTLLRHLLEIVDLGFRGEGFPLAQSDYKHTITICLLVPRGGLEPPQPFRVCGF